VGTLRRLMDIAIEKGQIHSNPVLVRPPTGRLKKKVQQKILTLPSMGQVERLFKELENNNAIGGRGIEAADLCRFLTCSGARIGGVPLTLWQHMDWDRKQMRLPGQKTQSSNRLIPLFPALEKLLKKIIERRKSAARFTPDKKAYLEPTDRILRLSECQKSINSA